MSLEEIKNDIKNQELEKQNKYDLTEGRHVLLIDLNSKEKIEFDWKNNKKLYYHKFNILNNGNKYVLFSNFLYSEFIKALKEHIDYLDKNKSVVETIINITQVDEKIKYNVKINMDVIKNEPKYK